jgi:hypothetical protein
MEFTVSSLSFTREGGCHKMSQILSVGVKIFKNKSHDLLEQEINDHLKMFENRINPVDESVNIQYEIAEETVLDNNGNPKKELIYSA